ncbi:MAG TPA: hypothetical protein VM889_05645 [Candidatus Thermoplasmatota archaeon]|nr:hypothetical protein [Candidatus Thermoplasmatota archaeon]
MSFARLVFALVVAAVVVWQAFFAATAYNAGNRVAAALFGLASIAGLMILAASRRPA